MKKVEEGEVGFNENIIMGVIAIELNQRINEAITIDVINKQLHRAAVEVGKLASILAMAGVPEKDAETITGTLTIFVENVFRSQKDSDTVCDKHTLN